MTDDHDANSVQQQQPVTFEVDRTPLVGTFHVPPATNGQPAAPQQACPCVVICHGLAANRIGPSFLFVHLSRHLAAAGIASLRFDFRGCGESDGRYQDLCLDRQIEDVTAAIQTASAHPAVDPHRIGLLGMSLGGLAAALAAARAAPNIPHLKAVALWAPIADLADRIKALMPKSAWKLLRAQGWVDRKGLRLGRKFFEDANNHDGPAALASTALPVFIAHGDRDLIVPQHHAQRYLDALTSNGRDTALHRLTDADHEFNSLPARQRLIDLTTRWFQQHL